MATKRQKFAWTVAGWRRACNALAVTLYVPKGQASPMMLCPCGHPVARGTVSMSGSQNLVDDLFPVANLETGVRGMFYVCFCPVCERLYPPRECAPPE